jgi:uncharacterized membrane protein
MTEITRSIEIAAPREVVWSHVQPKRWPEIFDFVLEVNGLGDHSAAAVGAEALVVAGDQETQVQYKIEVTEMQDRERIAYRRFDGPLAGRGLIQLKALQNGTLFRRISYYDDVLTEQTIEALSKGMEKDNLRIKTRIETSPSV